MIKIADGIIQLTLSFSNTFIVEASDGLTLMDAGMRWDAKAILRSISRLGWPNRSVHSIILTHGDLDHMGAVSHLVEATGAQLIAHRAEMPLIAARGWRPIVIRSGLIRGGATLYGLALQMVLPKKPVRVDRPVEDGDELPGGFQVIHTPGHTPGHIAMYHPRKRVLIIGDAILNLGVRVSGPAKIFTPNLAQAWSSVRRLAELDVETVGFGHGPPLKRDAGQKIRNLAQSLN